MDGSVVQTWMSDILHVITQGLLVPDIVLLIAFIAYALFCIGSVVVEYFTERRHFEVVMPKLLAALMSAKEREIPEVIEQSGLLKRQKLALLTVYDYRVLPGDALVALIRRLVSEEESRYDRISGRNNMAARVSPMLGLMGTLIPLGPGIQALGTANTELLSASLLIAFDTTVAGLVVAAICMVIGKIRGIWYANYMSALDSGMATMLQKIEDMRAEGKIVTKEPSDYAFLFEQDIAGKAGKAGKAAPEKRAKAAGADKDGKGLGQAAPPARGTGAATAGAAGVKAAASAPADACAAGASAAGAGASADLPAAPAPAETASDSLAAAPALAGVASGLAAAAPASPAAAQAPADAAPAAASSSGPVDYSALPVSFMREPFEPFGADASFAPVPDPAFITDLANAAAVAAADTGPIVMPASSPEPALAQAFNAPAEPVSTYGAAADLAQACNVPAEFDSTPAHDAPADPEPALAFNAPAEPAEPASAHAFGWYQPRLRSDDGAAQPYAPAGAYAQQPYPYQGTGAGQGAEASEGADAEAGQKANGGLNGGERVSWGTRR